jgi:hypothetical protein
MSNVEGLDQLNHFIRLWRNPPTTFGRLVRHDIAWAQFSLGTSKPFLTEVKNSLPHLKDKWYARLRQFLCDIGGSLDLQPSFIPPLERDNDMYIMDLILQNQLFTDEEIRQLNSCRLYLMAVTVSDLATAGGTCLDEHLLHGPLNGRQSSRTTCPHFEQGLPLSESHWILWKTANRL